MKLYDVLGYAGLGLMGVSLAIPSAIYFLDNSSSPQELTLYSIPTAIVGAGLYLGSRIQRHTDKLQNNKPPNLESKVK